MAKRINVKSPQGSVWSFVRNDDTKEIAEKVQAMSAAKQRLAMAKEYYDTGKGQTNEAQSIAGEAAIILYQGRANGSITGDELNAILRDVFGAKPKADGTPGKTPMGEGEALRKRIVRAVAASEYLANGEAPFFEGLPEDATDEDGNSIASTLHAIDTGGCSIFTAYETFAAIKRNNTESANAAFDAKKIAAIAETLANPSAINKMEGNGPLLSAYAALSEILELVGAELSQRAANGDTSTDDVEQVAA